MGEVVEAEGVSHTDDGMEAVFFTAEGDMRQALNNLQSTHAGFGLVNAEYVFKICDQPHPMIIKDMIECSNKHSFSEAHAQLMPCIRLATLPSTSSAPSSA